MRAAVICEPVRSAVGGYGGALRELTAHQLGSAVLGGLLERTNLDGRDIDDVLFGSCYPTLLRGEGARA